MMISDLLAAPKEEEEEEEKTLFFSFLPSDLIHCGMFDSECFAPDQILMAKVPGVGWQLSSRDNLDFSYNRAERNSMTCNCQ